MHNKCEGQFANIIYEEYLLLSPKIAIFINEQKCYDWQKRRKQLFIPQNENQFCILVKIVLTSIKNSFHGC